MLVLCFIVGRFNPTGERLKNCLGRPLMIIVYTCLFGCTFRRWTFHSAGRLPDFTPSLSRRQGRDISHREGNRTVMNISRVEWDVTMLPYISKLRVPTKSSLPSRSLRTATRSRSLTLPLISPQRIGLRRAKQQTIGQEQCAFFQLPYEIREMIWRAAVGSHCIARDVNGLRIGDENDPWPPWETPGGYRRGLRSWGWEPKKGRHFLGLVLSCRRIYSETIDILYESNIFYFRNPLSHWTLSNWKILPKRLQYVSSLVLDETIGDPSIIKSNPRNWKQTCTFLASMPRLKALYFNVDTLYPMAWNSELEDKLFAPLTNLNIPELFVIVRWSRPPNALEDSADARGVQLSVVRIDDFMGDMAHVNRLYAQHPAADMRKWIIEKLRVLVTSAP
ncbi:hypothetical protein EJ08DRAFT_655277 [Tothia fuscella]|uniref:DUF7730 domain-containing protein n=1 Tax=Tothia fuscella TaxID=1048955 RepID=A0A9P4P4K8_9PEZI|nr:hypothetical protein EJ08DRAFT_655277 [Tothia fuscella]